MSNKLATGLTWLRSKRHENATSTITIRRGASEAEVLATPGQSRFDHADDNGIVREIESRDWLIRTEDYAFSGDVVTPELGDRVVDTVDGVGWVYEVLSVQGEPAWRYADSNRATLRVHTKYIGQEQ